MKSSYGSSSSHMYILRTTLVGAVLGLGAPFGYFIFGYFFANPNALLPMQWFLFVTSQQIPLLTYLTIPTILVFALFGYSNGRQKSRLVLQAQQMEEFLHIAAHDIRGPVATALGAVGLLKDDLEAAAEGSSLKLASIVQRQLTNLQELLTGLLDIYKMESGTYHLNRQQCDVSSLLSKAADEISLSLNPKNLKLSITESRTQPTPILGEPFKIRQVFRNILSNATRYADEGSVIACHISNSPEGGTEISIHNDGPPAPPERLRSLFDKFAQATNRDQKLGYGLGLTICKNIMDLHGGQIWAENVEPSGFTMHVIFQ